MNTKENLSINSRILQIIDYKRISRYAFAKKTGVSEQLLSNIAKNKSKASIDVIQKILNNYEVNSNWLLTGKGEMLLNNSEDKSEIQQFNLKTDHSISNQEVPIYDIEATAGIVELFRDSSKGTVIDTIKIPNLPKSDGAVFVTGDSMYPLLKSGDIVIYKEVKDIINNIFWGEMYLISIWTDDEEYITVKYIQKSEKGEDYIKLVSQNKHHQDKDVTIRSVKALALIKASVRINSMG